jgi:FkbM family methyltransferase
MSAGLRTENEALRAQLAAVGEELRAARQQLSIMEAASKGVCDEAALSYTRREALFLVGRLAGLLPEDDRFVIVDAGARDADEDPRWRPFPPHRLSIFGFEPDAVEAARLNQRGAQGGQERQYYSAGLWGSNGTMRFEHNKSSGGSSFLRQNRAVTDRWKFENPTAISLASDIFFPTRAEAMRVVSLDDWAAETGVREIDFLKLNVQGGELEVLKGGTGLLGGTLGVLVEVSFVESYRARPMFADIDIFLRSAGFTFFDLLAHHYVGRAAAPFAAQHLTVVEAKLGQRVSAWGQLIEGHALYLRDPIAPDGGEVDVIGCIKLAALAEAYGQIEFAFEVLQWLLRRPDVAGTGLAHAIGQVFDEASEDYQRHLIWRQPH